MKNTIYLFAFILFGGAIHAQEENEADSTKIDFGGAELIIVEKEGETNFSDTIIEWDDEPHHSSEISSWGGIDMGVNIWLNADGENKFEGDDRWMDQNYAQSFSWDLNLIEKKINIIDEYVGIVTGLGLSYKKYGLADSISVQHQIERLDGNGNVVMIDSTYGVGTDLTFTKNKLRTSSLKIPLLLQINTSKNEDKNFHVAAGVLGGWNFRTMHKQKFEIENHETTAKTKGHYNTTDFTLDAHVRVGYKNFTLFATYGLTPFFEDGKGPEAYSATVGIQVIPF